VSAIVVMPDSATVVVGGTQSLTAEPEDANGNAVAGVSIVWAVSDTTIATVDTSGTVSTRAPGTVRVGASAQGVTGYAIVIVNARPVTSVTIAPNPATVTLNGTTTLTATLKDALGDTFGGQPVTWSSSDTTTVSITPSTAQTQVVTGKKGGSATISATSTNGVTGTDVVTVIRPVIFIQVTPNPLSVAVGSTVQASAQAFDANGVVINGTTFAWTTKSGGAIALVNASTGLVTGAAAGSDSVYAQAGGKQGGTPVTVLATSASAVTLTPALDSTALNGTAITLTATALAGGVQIPGTIALAPSNAGVVQLSTSSVQSGDSFTVTPGGPHTGSTAIQASLNGHMATATITVYPRDTITTQNVAVSESGRGGAATNATLTVQMRNADGTFDTSSQATWSGSDNGRYVTFSPSPASNDGTGRSSTTVTVTGRSRLFSTTVTVTATTPDGTATAQLTINP
jgi:hypothetical protein